MTVAFGGGWESRRELRDCDGRLRLIRGETGWETGLGGDHGALALAAPGAACGTGPLGDVGVLWFVDSSCAWREAEAGSSGWRSIIH